MEESFPGRGLVCIGLCFGRGDSFLPVFFFFFTNRLEGSTYSVQGLQVFCEH